MGWSGVRVKKLVHMAPRNEFVVARSARFAAIFLALAVFFSCRESPSDRGAASPSPASGSTAASPSAPPASPGAPPVASAVGTLFACANPLGVAGPFADHTWATSYDAPSTCAPGTMYWFSWGSCHATGAGTSARALGHAPGDLA